MQTQLWCVPQLSGGQARRDAVELPASAINPAHTATFLIYMLYTGVPCHSKATYL